MATTLPGFGSPAVGFEQPFEMLVACHERVRRSLALLQRLLDHVAGHGHDAQSRAAAGDVLRYFDLAAPLHHQDEELHVFPMLPADGDAALAAAVAGLRRDHARMEGLWAGLRTTLGTWSRADAAGGVDAALRQQVADFVGIYGAHIEVEEGRVYPAARARMEAPRLAAMSSDMQRRRRNETPP